MAQGFKLKLTAVIVEGFLEGKCIFASVRRNMSNYTISCGHKGVVELFSQYVINEINGLCDAKLVEKHSVASRLAHSAERAEFLQDAHILKFFSGALSMGYDFENNSYAPMFIVSTGARSFSMEDISGGEITILESVLKMSLPTWASAQLADILWLKCSNAEYGNLAVSKYLHLFKETFDPQNWVDCYNATHRAFDIDIRLGKDSSSFMQVKEYIRQALCKLDGTDPLFLSLNLIQLICKHASKDELENYLKITNKIFVRHVTEQDSNDYIVEESFHTQEILLKQLKRGRDIFSSKRKLAVFYESLAHRLKINGGNDTYSAIYALQKVCRLYNRNLEQDTWFWGSPWMDGRTSSEYGSESMRAANSG